MFRLFAIYDTKAKTYTQILTERTSAVAERNFTNAVRNKDMDYNKHAEDFSLFELGSYDNDTGAIQPHKEPILVCKAFTLLNS